MANLWQAYRNVLGGSAATLGQLAGAKEGRVSEWLTGKKEQTKPYIIGSAGGAYIDPDFTQRTNLPPDKPLVDEKIITGGVTGKGTGGGVPVKTGQIPPDTGELTTTQGQVLDEIDQAIQMGMDALNQYQSTIQPSADVQVQEAETTAGQQTRETRADEAARLGKFTGQRAVNEARTGSAIAESRRMASQLQQGIQARYGGSTHMGGAVSEVMGAQATQNIAQNRAALQETLGKIFEAEEGVKTAASNMLKTINENLQSAKNKALDWVRTAMAEVNSRKAALSGDKAKMRIDVINQYQTAIASLNETWRKEQNAITTKAQQAATKIQTLSQRLMPDYKAGTRELEFKNVNIGGTNYAVVPTGSNRYKYVPLKTTTTSSPMDEEEDTFIDSDGIIG